MKNLLHKYLRLAARIPKRHYWPIFIFISLYFIVPYSEFVVTLFFILYFKFEETYRFAFSKIISPLPDVIKYGGSVIFFLTMLDDTLFYAIIILAALWTSKAIKKLDKDVHDH